MTHSLIALAFLAAGAVALGIVARTLAESWHEAMRALDDRTVDAAAILSWQPRVRIVPPASAIRRGPQPFRAAA
jgi:hypothetical protein